MTVQLSLGAPGVYPAPRPVPDATIAPIRLDVTGFVGVAWRGPVDEPVAVTSWSQFVETFGGLTDPDGRPCPGLLPQAVRVFFDQGGAKAWVNRIAPVRPDPAATARFELSGPDTQLTAASEGTWGDRLSIAMTFEVSRSFRPPPVDDPDDLAPDELAVRDGVTLPRGSLLRLSGSRDDPFGTLHWVTETIVRPLPSGGRLVVARLQPPATGPAPPSQVAVVTGTLVVTDTDPAFRRSETITGLGLHPDHPRCPVRVLATESALIRPGSGWTRPLLPESRLTAIPGRLLHGGLDRFAEIDGDSVFDIEGADADPLDERTDHRGADRVGRVDEIGLLCVPDLTWSWQALPSEPPEAWPTARSSQFRPCAREPEPLVYDGPAVPATTHLDSQNPGELSETVRRQLRLAEIAAVRRRFVVLLDAPPRLSLADLNTWRSSFDSSYLAAYHPWLGIADARGGPAGAVPPSAFAAGVIAAREQRLGLPWGPANELAVSAVTASDLVTDAVHDQLHRLGINVFRAERDGFRLTAARTLSTDPGYRQLSVRRLMTMIALAVERQTQWLVFEPNGTDLRSTLLHVLTQFLADLFRGGAFAGATENEAFFVRCDDVLNPPATQGLGRLIAELGVAPASPLEYLILRLSQDTDGTVKVVNEP